MTTLRYLVCLSLCLMVSAGWGAESMDARKPPLRMGMLSYYDRNTLNNELRPIVEHINQTLDDREFVLHPMTVEEIREAIRFNQLEFVLTDPRHAMLLRTTNSLSGTIATMTVTPDDHQEVIYSFGGVILTGAERDDINALHSPAIRRVSYISKSQLGGYQAPLFEFFEAGNDLIDKATFIKQPDYGRLIQAVVNGESDVGFMRSGVYEGLVASGRLNPGAVKVLNRQQLPDFPYIVSTRLYPEWAVVALPSVPARDVNQIAAALLSTYDKNLRLKFMSPADYSAVELTARKMNLDPFDRVETVSWSQVWQQHSLTISFAALSLALLFAIALLTIIKNRQLNRQSDTLRELNDELEQRVEARVRDIENIFNASPDAILQLDSHGTITRANRQAEALFQYNLKDIVGSNVDRLVPEPERLLYRSLLESYMENPESKMLSMLPQDLYLVTRSGDRIPVDIRLSHTRTTTGSALIATVRDISAQRRMEASLIQAKEEAELASRKKAEFLANMSHEIRTPMNGVLGMAELLEEAALPPKYRRYLDTLQQSGRTLMTVINDILDYSKITEGKLEFEQITFNCREWAQSLTLPYRLTQRHVQMITDIDKAVPELIKGDSTRLSQVFNNLLNNAFKFTEQGSVTFRIQVEKKTDESVRLIFRVIDTGIGIDKVYRDKIFDQFEQADPSTTRKYGGTGLGLAISKQLVELSGGSISVHDNPGGGTCFQVALSFALADDTEHHQPLSATIKPLGQLRVLLVEDNTVNQQVVQAMLEKFGVKPRIVNNGKEALERLIDQEEFYDCVFMDCEMPIMDGYETTRQLRAWEQRTGRKRLTVCALTAHAVGDQVQHCIDSGMDVHLSKPLQLQKLQRFLQNLTATSRQDTNVRQFPG